MKEWFESREPRERLILAVGAAVVVVLVAWKLVWSPLSNGVERLDSSVESQSRLLVDAQTAAALAPRAAASSSRSTQSLRVVVDSTARSHGIPLAQIRETGTTELTARFQRSAFDALLGWLVTLESEHGIVVQTATITGSQEPGLVTGQVLLIR